MLWEKCFLEINISDVFPYCFCEVFADTPHTKVDLVAMVSKAIYAEAGRKIAVEKAKAVAVDKSKSLLRIRNMALEKLWST